MLNNKASIKPVFPEPLQSCKTSHIKIKRSFLLALGGTAAGLSYLFMQPWLSWFCLVPLFLVLDETKLKQSFIYSLIYGAIAALILFYWIIPVAGRYSGRFTFHSLIFYAGAVFYFSLYFALFGSGYRFLHRYTESSIISGASVSGLYVLLEIIKLNLFPGMPWFHYNFAVTQSQNIWAIQWASLGGIYIIIFTIVLFNYLLSQYLIKKETNLYAIASAVIIIFFGGGFLLSINKIPGSKDKFNAVILNENISAETRWNDLTGDSLANVFFRLNEEAAKYKPEMIIWSESAIPWKFETDDDFVPKVLRITYWSRADHLLGILSTSMQDKRLVYNSAYLIKYDGRIIDRYDKTILLDFLEKPFNGGPLTVLPFINISRYNNILTGRKQKVIKSGKADIGVLICNESLSEKIYKNYIKEGADLFILMSNDSWFENTMLQVHHFYITRLYAVMMGRDVIVNSNRGVTGLIRANGEINALPLSNKARIFSCEADLHNAKTVYFRIQNFTIPFYLLLTFISVFKRRH
ncbi:MAG: apolipoprotein N-acyltransferase [Bacteroidota bacterium]|nr:apolipoprotein N-acyltransferase [Bacteroidota bacterium]